ncbi:MAG: glycoside hydrolase TIM-barrel-like domain-containing protein [Wolbachia endosymbiont of Tyrophagus putrescentiae]|nr:glycoside hydrolase TIM-barrel-like domain-containing protein [Wolbachia endosymbiont of Tyrophagus putrescentiae]
MSIISILGSAIGKIIGSGLVDKQLDSVIFGLDAEKKVTYGARLKNLQIQTSAYGKAIPIIYGTARVAGNIIWAQPLKEETSSKEGKSFNVTYNYYATLAIAICKGEVKKLNRIWADTKSLSFDEIDYTFYHGTEEQNPDPFFSSIEDVPAYRGISYIVIKDFPLADYHNRVPTFTFEVQSILKSEGFSIAENIRNINIIPGSGEFVYDTKIQKKIAQQKINSNQYITYGPAKRINHNNYTKKSDAVLSLDQLKDDLPNIEWVSVVVNWFADNLNIENCKIYPAVEFQKDSIVVPDDWRVGDITRSNAQLISKDNNRNPRYGGTVSDSALVRYIEELHNRGYKVMLYPMLLLDTENKEWRGRLKGSPESISNFFSTQYNNFIEHYSNIAKRTKVEGFIIGSEFVELTKAKDEHGNHPAVLELVKLAKLVKLNLGKEVTITYAADWSEYHSHGGWYYIDELWSSEYIDVVGIDAYFPLTDGPEPPFGYSVEDVINGWNSGEGYDYFYDYSQDKPEQVKYNDSRYAWKNIEKWWSEIHINPDGSCTKWQPKMKKIWFTEYGFPSVNGCTNEPNVFIDNSSSESKYPRHSNKEISFLSQKIAIEGTLKKWRDSEMVERMFLWTWDARPFPYFPNLCKIWADCYNWLTGHWVQGKISLLNVSDVLSDLLQKAGLKKDEFDTSDIKGLLSGYVVNDQQSVRSIINMLQACYFFDVVEQSFKLKFVQKGREAVTEVPIDDMVLNSNSGQVQLSQLDLSNKVNVAYFNRSLNYLVDVKYAELPRRGTTKTIEIPITMEEGQAQNIAEILLYSSWQERNIYNFKLPIKYAWLSPSSVISILDGEKKHTVRVIKTKLESMSIQVSGVGYDHSIYKLSFPAIKSFIVKESPPSHLSKTNIDIIYLPYVSDNNLYFTLSGEEEGWRGAILFISEDNKNYVPLANVNRQSTCGYVMECNEEEFMVILSSGKLSTVSMALIGTEIIQFQNVELIETNKYKLSNLKREQQGTKKYTHHPGEKFTLLDDAVVPFKAIPGKKIFLKAVTYGDSLENTEAKMIENKVLKVC